MRVHQKKIRDFSISFIFSMLLANERLANAVDLDLMIKACEATSGSWSQLAAAITVPAVVGALIQQTSPLKDVCGLITRSQSASVANSTEVGKRLLYSVTENRFKDQLATEKRRFGLDTSAIDLESGDHRKGTIDSNVTNRQLNSWSQNTLGQSNSDLVPGSREDQRSRSSQIDRLSQLSRKRAILAEAISCPEAQGTTNYSDVIRDEIDPLQVKIDSELREAKILSARLKLMGPLIVNTPEEQSKFDSDLSSLMESGVTYPFTTKDIFEDNYKPVTDADNKVTRAKGAPLKHSVQTFRSVLDTDKFNSVRSEWSDRWGFKIDSAPNDSGQQYKPMTDECLETQLSSGMDKESSAYVSSLKDKLSQCESRITMNQKKARGLFDKVFLTFQNVITLAGANKASLKTKESFYTKAPVSTPDGSQLPVGKKASCDRTLTPAEMKLIETQQLAVDSEYREMIDENNMKKSMMKEHTAEKDRTSAEESQRKRDFLSKNQDSLMDSFKGSVSPGTLKNKF